MGGASVRLASFEQICVRWRKHADWGVSFKMGEKSYMTSQVVMALLYGIAQEQGTATGLAFLLTIMEATIDSYSQDTRSDCQHYTRSGCDFVIDHMVKPI